jgi:hypothetical protein
LVVRPYVEGGGWLNAGTRRAALHRAKNREPEDNRHAPHIQPGEGIAFSAPAGESLESLRAELAQSQAAQREAAATAARELAAMERTRDELAAKLDATHGPREPANVTAEVGGTTMAGIVYSNWHWE